MASFASDVDMSDRDFAKLRGIIHKETGITIGESRKSMLVSRLRSRLRECDAPNFEAYISRLATDTGEMQELTNRVTTNETYFYRTPRVWSHFREEVLPSFHADKQTRAMRVWSAAASTGEEAHTVAALLEEERASKSGFDYSVLGTDISSRVLDTAEKGVYRGRAIARFRKEDPEVFSRQMIGDEEEGYRLANQRQSAHKVQTAQPPGTADRPSSL